MRFKTILAGVSGGSASNGALELACRFAERFGAHLEAFHARLDPRDLLTYAGDGFGAMSGDDATAKETKASFEAAIARHQILQSLAPSQQSPVKIGASAAWYEETGYAPALVSQRARFFDLIVLGRSERVVNQPHTDVIEQTLINSGRPVLLAPSTPPTNVGEAVAVGWNGSAEATRALAVSLPFLVGARIVSLITVGDKHQESAAALIEYLAWHGIKGQHRHVPSIPGTVPGQQLLSAARDEDADLLVMGAYGQVPWREFLFGGATREVVGVSLLPLLLAH